MPSARSARSPVRRRTSTAASPQASAQASADATIAATKSPVTTQSERVSPVTAQPKGVSPVMTDPKASLLFKYYQIGLAIACVCSVAMVFLGQDVTAFGAEEWSASAFMAVAIIKIFLFCNKHPRRIVSFFCVWVVGVTYMLITGKLGAATLRDNALGILDATRAFSDALFALLAAWASFLLPFAQELIATARPLWRVMSLQQRLVVVLGTFSVYGLITDVEALATAGEIVFQVTFLAVAYLCANVLPLISPEWLEALAWWLFLANPLLLSWYAISARTSAQKAYWQPVLLSYWTTWPLLSLLFPTWLLESRFLTEAQAQTQLRVFIILLLWLQFYGGGKAVWSLVRLLASPVLSLFSVDDARKAVVETLAFGRGNLARAIELVRRHQTLAWPGALLSVALVMRVASKAVKPLALLAFAIDSLKVDPTRVEEKLAFWMCAALLQLTTLLLPTIKLILTPFGGEVVLLVALHLGGSKLVLWVLSLARRREHAD